MYSAAFTTLGCKLNQIETESMAESFRSAGFALRSWEEGADILIINTCTVTSRAEQKARRIIRKALRDHPHSGLIITGCYAQVEEEALAALEGEDAAFRGRILVLPGDLKGALLDLGKFVRDGGAAPQALLKTWRSRIGAGGDRFCFSPERLSFHSRAFLKIQDGCDNRCSYCRVRIARGPSVSLGAEQVLSRLRALEAAGYGEAVITGVNIGQYRGGDLGLGGLLEYLLRETGAISLRVSSLEPEAVGEGLAAVLAHPRIRPHFHLSLQSGSDRILEKMRRSYGARRAEEAAALLRSAKGDPFLGCDIITGFPGETPGEFEKTRELCRRIGFSWIHAFPYSPRPGTEAWGFSGAVSEGEAVKRVNTLLDLGRRGREDYIRRWTGRTVEAIIQTKTKKTAGNFAAVSDNNLRLLIAAPPAGELVPKKGGICRITASLFGGRESGFDASAVWIGEGGG